MASPSPFRKLLLSLEHEYEGLQMQNATLKAELELLNADSKSCVAASGRTSGASQEVRFDSGPIAHPLEDDEFPTFEGAICEQSCESHEFHDFQEADIVTRSRSSFSELTDRRSNGSRSYSSLDANGGNRRNRKSPKKDPCKQCGGVGCSLCCTDPFEIWPVWLDAESAVKSRLSYYHRFSERSKSRVGAQMRGFGWLQRFVSQPGSIRFIFWDISSFFVMGYDCIVIPLQAFELQPTAFTSTMSWVTTVFWTVDILLSFTRGFQSGVSVEMRPQKIAKRYIQSWFAIDLAIASIDWFLILSESGGFTDLLGLARVMKGLRILRVLRMLRFFRVVKLLSVLEDLSEYIHSEEMWTAFAIMKLIILIVLVNHFLACGWYGITLLNKDRHTWIKQLAAVDSTVASFGWHYTSALHWSITQFTPASMEIVPCNVPERIYCICVILFALVAFSSFVSSITSAMTHIRAVQTEETKQEKQLQKYITENTVSIELGKKIIHFMKEHRRTFKTRVHEYDIPILKALPGSARLQLHAELFSPILATHPFWDKLADKPTSCMSIICHKAATELTLTAGLELCSPGQLAVAMYFIVTGRIQLSDLLVESDVPALGPGEYLCEMSLWVHWLHQDLLVANVNSELISLDSKILQSIALTIVSFPILRRYAALYAERLNCVFHDTSSPPSDTWGSRDAARLSLNGIAQQAFTDE